MPSEVAITESIGAAGGIVLALCLIPQIWKVWRTKSAQDISYWWQAMYTVGLIITLAYLVRLNAIAGYVSVSIEILFALQLVGMKMYYDRQGKKQVTRDDAA
ncbi:hypothetical protein RI367_000263 [Sorochytrium milnesiophthora]